MEIRNTPSDIGDHIARVLKLDNPPYGRAANPWVPFLDDLITLSDRVDGLALAIDNAHILFAQARNDAFDLIESFLIQFHHWFEKKKPCHLCFQMEENKLVREAFKE